MSYRFRNILFAIFSIVFVVMTLIFSLYASGYRISFFSLLSGRSFIQKTGILAVDSSPKGANVYLNRQFRGVFSDNEILKNKNIRTPYKIKNLIPGDYVLTFELNGYWPWEQRISIFPGQSTYIEDVVLFRRNLPFILLNSKTQDVLLDFSGRKIILKDDNEVFDLKSEEKIDLGKNISSIDLLGSNKFLLNNSLIFDHSKNNYFDFSGQDFYNFSKLRIKNNQLFYLREGLNNYDFSSKKINPIFLMDNIIDYDFYNDFYFFIIKENNSFIFRIYSYKNKELVREIPLSVSENCEIITPSGPSAFVYIYDKNFKTIYVVNTMSKFSSFWSTINNVEGFNFIDGNNFVYFSDFEIYIFNTVLSESFLVGRFDSRIKSLVWHPKNYIIYSTDSDIVILDLKYDKYSIRLVSLNSVSNLVLDKIGSTLYFTGRIGNQEGLYKLFIQ